jgi:hypothetical protein
MIMSLSMHFPAPVPGKGGWHEILSEGYCSVDKGRILKAGKRLRRRNL